MKFAQIIEFTTSRIDDFNANLDAWITRTKNNHISHHTILSQDRDADDRYLLMVEFASYDKNIKNSNRPKTSEFAAALAEMSAIVEFFAGAVSQRLTLADQSAVRS